MSKYEVRGVKSFRGNEGMGFNATLYRDGVKVALVDDAAQGGQYDFQWLDSKEPRVELSRTDDEGKVWTWKVTPEEAKLHEHVKGMLYPPSEDFPKPLELGMDGFVSKLVDDFENAKRLAKGALTKTMFVVRKDGREVEFSLNAPYTPEVKAHLEKKYGTDLVRILNTAFVPASAVAAQDKKWADDRLKRLCKTQTVFRLVGQAEGAWMVVRRPFDSQMKDLLVGKYGDKVVEILNETLGQAA